MVTFSFVPCIFSQLDSFLEFYIVDTYSMLVELWAWAAQREPK